MINGERLSYRALDVEHIGSAYKAMMSFTLLRVPGPMIVIKSVKAHGAGDCSIRRFIRCVVEEENRSDVDRVFFISESGGWLG